MDVYAVHAQVQLVTADAPPNNNAAHHCRDAYANGLRQERVKAAVTVTAAVFSPCGGYLICASDSGRLAVWELAQHMEADADTQSLPP